MKKEELFNIIGEVDEQKVAEANKNATKKKQPQKTWLKWGAFAACICIVIASVIGISTKREPLIVTLKNGDEINFSTKGGLATHNIMISIGDNRDLSETESNAIFGRPDVDASVVFEEGTNEFIILNGTIDGFKIEVHRKNIPSCIVIEGEESVSYINDIPVTAGYFITDANSKGKRRAIVYGEFEIGNYRVYLETAGDKSELETLCNELAKELYKLIENASLDFEVIKHSNS